MHEPSRISVGPSALTGPWDKSNHADLRPCTPASSNNNSRSPGPSTAIARIPPEEDSEYNDEPESLEGDGMSVYDYYGYNSSESSAEHSSSDMLACEREFGQRSSTRASSHSSMSSISASALVHSKSANNTCDHGLTRRVRAGRAAKAIGYQDRAVPKSNSMGAIETHEEDQSDNEYLAPSWGRRQRHSDFSIRSTVSSPLRRSPHGSANKQKVKNEYPLVLLHCTLLPPSLPVTGVTSIPNPKILKEVLPQKYWRRWKHLEEKVGSIVVRDRGVLVSHPQDSYDLLEERLLESLELQRPRLHHDHFLGYEAYDSDKDESATDEELGEVCPDCGGRVVTCNDRNRKWEVRVFAANGLMRAGAWAAAWKEMEKVDVEVGLWLPTEVRRELERRLLEDGMAMSPSDSLRPSPQRWDTSTSIDHVFLDSIMPHTSPSPAATTEKLSESAVPSTHKHKPTEEIDFRTLLVNYIRVLTGDRRNIALAILSILVVFFAIGSARSPTPVLEVQSVPQEVPDVIPSSAVSMSISYRPSAEVVNTPLPTEEIFMISNPIPTSAAGSQVSSADEPSTTSDETSDLERPTAFSDSCFSLMSTATSAEDLADTVSLSSENMDQAEHIPTPEALPELSASVPGDNKEPLPSSVSEKLSAAPVDERTDVDCDADSVTESRNTKVVMGTTGMG